MFKFHQLMNLSRLILRNTIKTAAGIINVRSIFIGNGKRRSKKKFMKKSSSKNIGTTILQKMPEEILWMKSDPGTFKISL